jgi:hypothetical protein
MSSKLTLCHVSDGIHRWMLFYVQHVFATPPLSGIPGSLFWSGGEGYLLSAAAARSWMLAMEHHNNKKNITAHHNRSAECWKRHYECEIIGHCCSLQHTTVLWCAASLQC